MAFLILESVPVFSQQSANGAAGSPYPNMPVIAPIGVKNVKLISINESAKGPAIDPAKGYRLQESGKGLYMITDNQCYTMEQSLRLDEY